MRPLPGDPVQRTRSAGHETGPVPQAQLVRGEDHPDLDHVGTGDVEAPDPSRILPCAGSSAHRDPVARSRARRLVWSDHSDPRGLGLPFGAFEIADRTEGDRVTWRVNRAPVPQAVELDRWHRTQDRRLCWVAAERGRSSVVTFPSCAASRSSPAARRLRPGDRRRSQTSSSTRTVRVCGAK